MLMLASSDFFQILTFFQEHYQSVNNLDPDQDQHSVGPNNGSKLFAMIISRWQKSPVACKELTGLKTFVKVHFKGSDSHYKID